MSKQHRVMLTQVATACYWAFAAMQFGHAAEARVHPGDDFDAYANGDWLAATEIPAASARWTGRNEISELTRRQLDTLIDDAARAAPRTDARKVADFHSAYLDAAAIEAQGMVPLRPLLDRIAAVHDKGALTR